MNFIVNRRRGTFLIGSCVVLLSACPALDQLPPEAQKQALQLCEDNAQDATSAVLKDVDGESIGLITFTAVGDSTVVAVAAKLPPDKAGIHGFHIHANDDPSNGEGCIADPQMPATTHFASADGHLNPGHAGHGHHMGDMPALFFTKDGIASMRFVTDTFHIHDLIGAAVVLHAGADNYGNIPVGENPDQYSANSDAATDLTAKTGNGGARIACGVIQ